ncbi:MAG: diguanylate cyclase [Nitrospirae bacterium]|nr:diguanylate cyclase [Nitrospirota bacterium]
MAFNIFNERLKSLFDFTSDGVIILDHAMKIVEINPAAEAMTGWKASERRGSPFPYEKLISLDPAQKKETGVDLFNTAESRHDLEMEVTLLHGNKLHLPATSFPISGEGGEQFFGLILENILMKEGVVENLIRQERLDEMTGLLHKDYFQQVSGDEIRRMNKNGGTLGAILIQIKNLDKIREKFGSVKGSETIKKVGSLVKGNSRDIDLVCRYDENEFLVLLINSDTAKMSIILRRLKEKLVHSNKSAHFPAPVRIRLGNVLVNDHYEEIFKAVKLSLDKFV